LITEDDITCCFIKFYEASGYSANETFPLSFVIFTTSLQASESIAIAVISSGICEFVLFKSAPTLQIYIGIRN